MLITPGLVLSHVQPKSAEQREKVRKASTEGIAIQGQQGSRLLPEQLLKEAFILSDLFDIGELAALELLLAGKVDMTCKKMCHVIECVLCLFLSIMPTYSEIDIFYFTLVFFANMDLTNPCLTLSHKV